MQHVIIENDRLAWRWSVQAWRPYTWAVFDIDERLLASGDSDTGDGALRAARNFIRRNQNRVFRPEVATEET